MGAKNVKRDYTVSAAVVEQRTAAAKQPRGGARVWINVRVSAGVLAAIDAQRGDRSRNDFLSKLLNVKEGT